MEQEVEMSGENQVKILLVDDMRNFLDLEVSFLKRSDVNILTAMDGVEALKIAKAEKPDLILLDIEMPRMNGIEVCRIIKNDPSLKHIPVVMVTSTNRYEEAMNAGADDFWRKPIFEEDFLKGIKKFVDIKERKDIRVPVGLQVDYRVGESKNKVVQAFTANISKGGLFLITRDTLPVGSRIEMEIHLPDRKIEAVGEVVREVKEEEEGYYTSGMGIKIVDISDEDRKAYESFIDEKLKGKES